MLYFFSKTVKEIFFLFFNLQNSCESTYLPKSSRHSLRKLFSEIEPFTTREKALRNDYLHNNGSKVYILRMIKAQLCFSPQKIHARSQRQFKFNLRTWECLRFYNSCSKLLYTVLPSWYYTVANWPYLDTWLFGEIAENRHDIFVP